MTQVLLETDAPPRAGPARRSGRAIAIACAGALAGALGAADVGLAWGESGPEGLRLAARYTARFAFLLFLPVYAASAWHRLAPSAASRFVLARRRALGLAFASAHTVHLAALTGALRAAGETPDPATLVGGGGAYLLTFAMAATSSDAAVRRLGRHWRKLHRVGVHWLWFVFAFSYAGRVAAGDAFFAPFLVLALGALALRLVAWRTRRRTPARAGQP
jgi:methionine sulfoxide reductase heme-binding subunit